MRNLQFLLYDVFDAESVGKDPFFDYDRGTFDTVLQTGATIAGELLQPNLRELDKHPPELVDGILKVHPSVKTFLDECGSGGWISAGALLENGGQQMPMMIVSAFRFIFAAANYSLCVYPFLTSGAARLIENFGSEEMKSTYLPRMFSGEWQGTMALTEPQAGSSLSDLSTTAVPDGDQYKLSGQKIFISSGDHDAVNNIVHLVLAKIKGAPPGVKGISLFVVPKLRDDGKGNLVPNDVTTAAIYHKMGYRGAPITQLSFGEQGDCHAYLVGQANSGLSYMFQMMNEARLEVGSAAAAMASAAYYASLEYAQERPQGRRLNSKDSSLPPVPIIEHPDVKRMLLFQRAVVEGSLSLVLQCAKYADMARVSSGDVKADYELLLDLLTPVAKSYPSEMAVSSVSQGLQILGGYGYCDEYPLEQLYRDVRIHPIHEGTTGIQAIDLLGRKVLAKSGKAFARFVEELRKAITQAEADAEMRPYGEKLSHALGLLQSVTEALIARSAHADRESLLADATLYLEAYGIVAIAWQWLLQGLKVQEALRTGADGAFYRGKWDAMRYFFHYELPKVQYLTQRLSEDDALTARVSTENFKD